MLKMHKVFFRCPDPSDALPTGRREKLPRPLTQGPHASGRGAEFS